MLPLISVGIASTQNSPALLICLGEGYKNYFFSAEIKMCNYNNPIWNNACKLFFVLQAILISNLIDIYCAFSISKMINTQTEAAKSLIGQNTYISRKKYVDHTLSKIERLKKLKVCTSSMHIFLFFSEIMESQSNWWSISCIQKYLSFYWIFFLYFCHQKGTF